MKNKISTERCRLCRGLTGKFGRDDDSIFVVPIRDDEYGQFLKNFELGPLCEECKNALITEGYIEIDSD